MRKSSVPFSEDARLPTCHPSRLYWLWRYFGGLSNILKTRPKGAIFDSKFDLQAWSFSTPTTKFWLGSSTWAAKYVLAHLPKEPNHQERWGLPGTYFYIQMNTSCPTTCPRPSWGNSDDTISVDSLQTKNNSDDLPPQPVCLASLALSFSPFFSVFPRFLRKEFPFKVSLWTGADLAEQRHLNLTSDVAPRRQLLEGRRRHLADLDHNIPLSRHGTVPIKIGETPL